MVYPVPPGTLHHTVYFHGVPSPSMNRLSYCVFLWCTQYLQEHFTILCTFIVYPVPPRTGYPTVSFYGVPNASRNTSPYCVLSWCTQSLHEPVTYCVFLWCTQCLQEHFTVLCSLMMYPVPPISGYHSASFYGVPNASRNTSPSCVLS